MSKGFFLEEDKKKKIVKKSSICEKCKLFLNCENSKIKFLGKGRKKILLIGESPNRVVIKFLKRKCKEYDIDFENDCWFTTAVICQLQVDKTPTTAQVNYCRFNLKKNIKLLQPEKIITFGKIALQSLIGEKTNINKINRWVGWKIPDQDYKCYIFPNFHPHYLFKNVNNVIIHKYFDQYFKFALDWSKKVQILDIKIDICDEEKAIKKLYNLDSLKKEIIAIDYETTGLKPHKEGHEILCISVTNEDLYTFVFMLTEKIKPYFMNILKSSKIKKIAHNCQFENNWSNWLLCKVNNWFFDTKIAAHILDNRSSITGLKFQAYVNFGIIGYDIEAEKYISSKEKGANEFNSMKEMDPKKMMLYCGKDTYFTMLLYQKQKLLLDNHLRKGFKLFLEGAFVLGELGGINFDYASYKKSDSDLIEKIRILHNKIINSKEVKKLKEKKEEFNYNSTKQLRELLFNICKWGNKNKTATGLQSVSEETLLGFDKRFTNNILKRRKLVKIKDTYLAQFKREAVFIKNKYYLFPFFDLNTARSMRGSSYLVNFQNIPVRNELAKNITRSTILPREGNQLLEIDFKSMEVATGCCIHKDPVMINYIENSKNDMHRDVCLDLFCRTKETYTKYERFCSKSGFVFPSFYGSTSRMYTEEDKKRGFGVITENIWEMISDETKEYLAKNGIPDIYFFQEHVEKIEDKFWNNRFRVYKQWKFDNWKKYKQKGYIKLKTGFTCYSIMSFNAANNYPIQGAAFHILLWCLIQLFKYIKKNRLKSMIIGQIHDSIVIDLDPYEKNHLIGIIKEIATKKVREYWEWIIVPLSIEAEITPINGAWNTKKEIVI